VSYPAELGKRSGIDERVVVVIPEIESETESHAIVCKIKANAGIHFANIETLLLKRIA
jgi:hypothetical protein